MFPAVFNISSLNGQNGFVINGNNNNGGISISRVGDINDDGLADIILGASSANNGAGQSYVIFGSKYGFPNLFNLANLNGTNGFVINGINPNDGLGSGMSQLGDVNGDDIDDFIISAYSALNLLGQSYVIFGSKNSFPNPFNVEDLNGNNGFIINGFNNNITGSIYTNWIGDMNDDGVNEIAIAMQGPNNLSNNWGQVYVIFGSKSGFPNPFNLADLNGQNGFTFSSISTDNFVGSSLSGAVDINYDGLDDLLIGGQANSGTIGKIYVIYGSRNSFNTVMNETSLNGQNGFIIEDNTGLIGFPVSGLGDVNGDEIDDVILGGPGGDNAAGISYLVFGSKGGFSNPFNLTTLNGSNGFLINGISSGDYFGSSLSGKVDVNGDGIDDIITGAPNALNFEGQNYVIFGSKNGFPASFNLSTLNGNNGFTINGISSGYFTGICQDGLGDVNGDGIDDFSFCAMNSQNTLAQSYVVFGESMTSNDF